MGSIKISGLSSGLDIDSIVQQLMMIERMPLSKLNTKKNDYQADKSAWQSINSSLLTLQSKITDLSLDATYNVKKVTSIKEDIATGVATTNAANGSYDVTVSALAKAHRVASDKQTDSTSSLGFTGSFTMNGKTVTIDDTNNSLNGIRDAINAVEGVGVNATIIDNTLVLSSKSTGLANAISITDTDGVLTNLGVSDGSGGFKNVKQEAADADVTVNGVRILNAGNKIEGVIDNLTLDLKAEGSTKIQVTDDTQSTVDKIKSFVDQFNTTYSLMRKNSRKDQTTGKFGTLYSDASLISMESNLRNVVTTSFATGNDIKALSIIGIAFDKEGKLTLDETRLKETLTKNPNEVKKLFTATQSEDGFDGFAAKMDSWLDANLQTGGIISKKQDLYNEMIDNIDDQIDSMEVRLDIREKNLNRQFTEMEKMLGQMQTQGNWLTSQLAGLSFNS